MADWHSALASHAPPISYRCREAAGPTIINYGTAGAALDATAYDVLYGQPAGLGAGEAVKYHKSTSRIVIPNHPAWSSASGYSFIFRLKVNAYGNLSNGYLMFVSGIFRINFESDGTLSAKLNGANSRTTQVYPLGSEPLLVVTLNRADTSIRARIYLSAPGGIAECNYSVQTPGNGAPIPGTMLLGNNIGLARGIGPEAYLNEFAFCDRALTLPDIQALEAVKDITGIIPTIHLCHPAPYEVVGRSTTGTGAFAIVGSNETASTADIAANDGTGWRTIARNIAPGACFAGQLASPPGQYPLQVAIKGRETEAERVDPFGVGDVFGIAGQSNPAGWGDALQTTNSSQWIAGMLDSNGVWQKAIDPTSGTGKGSYWMHTLTELQFMTPFPVNVVPCAVPSTSIDLWQPDPNDHENPNTLYGAMLRRLRMVQGTVRGIWWHQGESDWMKTQTYYHDMFINIVEAVRADVGCWIMPCLLQSLTGWNGANNSAVNAAIVQSYSHPNVRIGPDFSDITLVKPPHFTTNSELVTAGTRWAYATYSACYT